MITSPLRGRGRPLGRVRGRLTQMRTEIMLKILTNNQRVLLKLRPPHPTLRVDLSHRGRGEGTSRFLGGGLWI